MNPSESESIYRGQFCIGGITTRLTAASAEDANLLASLEPFRSHAAVPNIDISVKRVVDLSPVSGRQLFNSGTTWELHEVESGFQFDFHLAPFGLRSFKRLLVDHSFRDATLLMNDECLSDFRWRVPPLGYPVDELLITHRLTQERAIELHGCGIVTADGIGNLFIGHSGAGKSTTTRLWTATEDVEILSDDRIIVREHPGQMRMYGTPWHGEAMFASPASAPLTRIMILEHGHGNVLTRLSPSQAVAELFARSFVPMHRHEYVESALEFLQSVAELVPCYRYSFEPDPRAVEKILNLLD